MAVGGHIFINVFFSHIPLKMTTDEEGFVPSLEFQKLPKHFTNHDEVKLTWEKLNAQLNFKRRNLVHLRKAPPFRSSIDMTEEIWK